MLSRRSTVGNQKAVCRSHPWSLWMKIGAVPPSPSFCQKRQAQTVQRSADQVCSRFRSCTKAFGWQREHCWRTKHPQVEHRQCGRVPEWEVGTHISLAKLYFCYLSNELSQYLEDDLVLHAYVGQSSMYVINLLIRSWSSTTAHNMQGSGKLDKRMS